MKAPEQVQKRKRRKRRRARHDQARCTFFLFGFLPSSPFFPPALHGDGRSVAFDILENTRSLDTSMAGVAGCRRHIRMYNFPPKNILQSYYDAGRARLSSTSTPASGNGPMIGREYSVLSFPRAMRPKILYHRHCISARRMIERLQLSYHCKGELDPVYL